MKVSELFCENTLPPALYWFNAPERWHCGNGLEIFTDRETDFWQRTHYGFRKDDGHCLFARVASNFVMSAHVRFDPRIQYDQCGLMVRADAEHWIKMSTELEDDAVSRLGSVVTNLGFSDWATQDVPTSQRERWYRITREGDDFMLEHSNDGVVWQQMRVAHLHNAPVEIEAGLYACSPKGEAFYCVFTQLEITA